MTATATPTAASTDRSRWLALYVLCAGTLMIVLDATIVNVALPSIQEDLGFSQSSLAWVVNAYLIAFGGLLLLAGRLGDLVGPRRVFLTGLTDLHRRLARLRAVAERGDARHLPFRPGRRRRAHLGRRPRDDRHDVPRPARPGEGARRVRVRGLRRRVDRPAGRRHPDRRDQLALDLPREPADRRRGRIRHAAPRRGPPRPRPARGRRRTRRRAPDGGPHARRLRDPAGPRARLGRDAHAAPRRHRACAARDVRRPPGADRQPAHAAAALPLARRDRREHHHGASSSSGCSASSSWARCTCSRSSATTPSRSASRSCPARSSWPACRSASPDGS